MDALIAPQVLPLGAADNLFPLEVHIRTGEMHRLAQYGIACERWVRIVVSMSSHHTDLCVSSGQQFHATRCTNLGLT